MPNIIELPERPIGVADIVMLTTNGDGSCAVAYNNGGGSTSFNTVKTVAEVITLANVDGVRLIPVTTTDGNNRGVNAARINNGHVNNLGQTDLTLNWSGTSTVIHVTDTLASVIAAANA